MALLEILDSGKKPDKKIIGCYPLYPPRELFYAANFIPITLWDLKNKNKELNESDHHLQNYACSVSRYLLQFILSGGYEYFDAFFFYNACDTLRNMPEIMKSGLHKKNREIPFFNIHLPAGGIKKDHARQYFRKQINNLIDGLNKNGYEFCAELFLESTILFNKIRNLLINLEQLVGEGKISYRVFSDIIKAENFKRAEDNIAELQKHFNNFRSNPGNKLPGILISGILPPPGKVISIIENCGLRVAGNDVATQRRSYAHSPLPSNNPADFYADFYHNHHPCPTLHFTADRREENLIKYLEKTGAKGIIFVGEKFCEYEYFEFPFMEKTLKINGIQCLNIELSAEDSGDFSALQTRIEAFAELLLKKQF